MFIEGNVSDEHPGYAQNGAMMRRKLRQLQSRLEHLLMYGYPGGVEMVCPDGTITLVPGTATGVNHGELATRDLMDMNLRGWWMNLDTVNQYKGLLKSLEVLAAMLRENPFDGIIGFSQGATLATMLAALCEGGTARLRALARQGEHISIVPPQSPFKFALLSCGYKGTEKYYSGFYSPQLTTPILFDIATLDHMVEPWQSDEWVSVCAKGQKMLRQGGHLFPTNEKSLCGMASFVSQALLATSELRHLHSSAAMIRSTPRITNLHPPRNGAKTKKWIATDYVSHVDMPISSGRLRCAQGATSATSALRVWSGEAATARYE